MNCPICGSNLEILRTDLGKAPHNWFVSRCFCVNCGSLKIDGTIKDMEIKIAHFHPSCTIHGLLPVIVVCPGRQWFCTSCERTLKVEGGKLVQRMPKQPPIDMYTFATASA